MRHARGAYGLRESMRVVPCNRRERGRWPTDVPKISGDDAGGGVALASRRDAGASGVPAVGRPAADGR